jgi:hypothetical protein
MRRGPSVEEYVTIVSAACAVAMVHAAGDARVSIDAIADRAIQLARALAVKNQLQTEAQLRGDES